jgi:hypothetical protein
VDIPRKEAGKTAGAGDASRGAEGELHTCLGPLELELRSVRMENGDPFVVLVAFEE